MTCLVHHLCKMTSILWSHVIAKPRLHGATLPWRHHLQLTATHSYSIDVRKAHPHAGSKLCKARPIVCTPGSCSSQVFDKHLRNTLAPGAPARRPCRPGLQALRPTAEWQPACGCRPAAAQSPGRRSACRSQRCTRPPACPLWPGRCLSLSRAQGQPLVKQLAMLQKRYTVELLLSTSQLGE